MSTLSQPRVVDSVRDMQSLATHLRSQGKTIGLVPTMGYLHDGHASLLHAAKNRADTVVLSIFVNPTQFGPNEDLDRYPRDLERDLALARACGVDVVFAPTVPEMYPPGSQTWVEVTQVTSGLCGARRPGHFRGVTTVVSKLFNIVQPTVAFFGEKDFQQLIAIKQMVRDLNLSVEVVGCPIVREEDGLAMSSRNKYLSATERREALTLKRALDAAQLVASSGVRDPEQILGAAWKTLRDTPALDIEYVELIETSGLGPVRTPVGPARLCMAVRIGQTRLIDNAPVERL